MEHTVELWFEKPICQCDYVNESLMHFIRFYIQRHVWNFERFDGTYAFPVSKSYFDPNFTNNENKVSW